MTILQSAIAQSAAGGGAYQISRSLRFNVADSATLSRTPGTAGNRKTWTWSGWIKRSTLGISTFFQAGYNSAPWLKAGFNPNDTIQVSVFTGSSAGPSTTAVYRDLSAWYHVVVAFDTTQATAANRTKLYVNGVQVDFTTDLNFPSLNTDYPVNNTVAHSIGGYSGEYVGGYIAEVYFIDGQALTPTSFGETDTATGVWMPKQVTGMTYGTNGFYLNFSDNSNTTAATLGADTSGNGNNFTPNNFSVTAGAGNDSLVDTPTNYGTDTGVGGEVRGNYCTLNPLDNGGNTLADGNLSGSKGGSPWASTRATLAFPTSGKWYWEAQITAGGNNMTIGIANSAAVLAGDIIGRDANGWGYVSGNGQKWTNGSGASYGATWTVGDIMGIAFDADAGTLTFYKNNTSQGTAFSSLTSGPYFPGVSFESTTGYVNFGQRPFAYTAPSGFKALCTQNLPTPAIGATSSTLASKNMNVVTYTGNGSTQSITGLGLSPDLVWYKDRSAASSHGWFDRVRGATAYLASDNTGAESTVSGVTSFDSDGFSLGSNAGGNFSGRSYVGWTWKGGGTGVSNTNGSITSTVSANTTAGISIVGYTGTGANATVGHGLGVAPKMVILKSRSAVKDWIVGNSNYTSWAYIQKLNDTIAQTSVTDIFNSTAPTSSVFSLGSNLTSNTSGATYIAYCFAEVAGFSKFGKYTGNGSADGPFVYCGFRPRYIMIKGYVVAGAYWIVIDTARDTYNVSVNKLGPNVSDAENSANLGNTTQNIVDILSNGFKLRSTTGDTNNGSQSYIFAAFAESPFNYSRAR